MKYVADFAKYTRFIEYKDLDKWEALGWRAIAGYREVSDEIESIIIGWFYEDSPPQVLNEGNPNQDVPVLR